MQQKLFKALLVFVICSLVLSFVPASKVWAASTVVVVSPGDVSATENDFTVLQTAVGSAASGDTIDIQGTLDWSAANPLAHAAYLASYEDSPSKDIRGVKIPAGVDHLTITSSTGDAHIIGVGDVVDLDANNIGILIFASFLYSDTGAGNPNLTVEKLTIDNFEGAVTLGWEGGTFNNTLIQNNHVMLAGDNGDAIDWHQNIAFYFGPGQNQTITGNTVIFNATGTRTQGYFGPKNGASFGFQNSTSGGNLYNGLLISNNTFQVGSGSNGLEETFGIWENSHNDTAGTVLRLVDNQFLGRTGDLFDHAFLLSSQSSGLEISGNTLNGVDEVFTATKSQGHSAGDQYTFKANTLTNVGGADGIFLKNVTNDTVPVHVVINWDVSNTIDSETGVRGLNELSTQASHASRPDGAAVDMLTLHALPVPVTVAAVSKDWGTAKRFTDTDGLGAGFPIAVGYNTFDSVQAGIQGVAADGTVNVLAGTYPETGQIIIAKNLTLVGHGSADTILKPTANTGSDFDTRAWIQVNTGVTFNLSNFTLDGKDFNIVRAIQSTGSGTIAHNRFQNIVAPGYNGVAISIYNPMTVSDNTFTAIGRIGILASNLAVTPWEGTADIRNNTYTGKGLVDALDYGIEVGAGARATVTGNVVTGNLGVASTDGSTSAGIYVDSFFDPGGTQATLISNTVTNNYAGIAVGYEPTDNSVVTASFNRIFGNTHGITTTGPAVLATNNWWGCNAGPADAACDSFDGAVTTEPWLVLTPGAAPAPVQPLGTAPVTANLVKNSAGDDTTSSGSVSDLTPATFTALDGGSVVPTDGTAVAGVFTTTFTAPKAAGPYQVCTVVDNQTVCSTLSTLNVAPTAVADTYTVDGDTKLTVVVGTGVLANDTDSNGDALTAVLDATTTHGTLSLAADGSFTYEPTALFHGTDTFTYHANDGTLDSNVVTVTITVKNTNNVAPTAVADTYSVNGDAKLTILVGSGVLVNDTDSNGDALTAVLNATTTHGKLTLAADGSFTYEPTALFNGTDTFTYHANDGTADSNVVTVTITVKNTNNVAPAAVTDTYTVDGNTMMTVAISSGVLVNDTDGNNDSLTAVLNTTTTHGKLTLAANGSFTYQPDALFFGTDTFTYHANDGMADSNVITVTITVKNTNKVIYIPVMMH